MKTKDSDEFHESSQEAIERARETYMAIKRIEAIEEEILKDGAGENESAARRGRDA